MTSPRLLVNSETTKYPIYIDTDLRYQTYELINKSLDKKASAFIIIADDTVAGLYLDDVVQSFPSESRPYVATVPSGEASKSFEQYERLLTECLKNGLDRQAVIIALGGGVTGDLAGFVAASYMRGVRYVQMPSTLLAHDSSVGGKTGINHPMGKNLIGAFHPPAAVIYDSGMLYTLPEKEWRSGFAEVIKHGFIADPSFLKWVEENIQSFKSIKTDVLNELLRRSIKVKAEIVEKDEKEQGIRAFLNFGHTLGHSIEAELGYGRMTHGEAVAVGMIFALKLSEKVYKHSLEYERTCKYMNTLGYRLEIPAECNRDRLLERMKLDKKASYKQINFVLLKELGHPELRPVKEHDISELLKKEGNSK
ncbi:3-dehydroquinate synthase [Salipaludibacillus sp. CUR1]|uniref:3-dehydroquinate synthase n=1 Tax=Salipaludibacillus sp. CUR1 TaxID=2820003 RepID=UPI001E57547C|nr:3-dehydroquinate synthase [Salipaludibacillus sp. CUR1]MCE7793316.1 3-dehydroquinate synthase [Salipaludibacillus sp. CUR1]